MGGKKNKKQYKVSVVKGFSFQMSVQPKKSNDQHNQQYLSATVNSIKRSTRGLSDEARQKFLNEMHALEDPLEEHNETCTSPECHAVFCEARQMFMEALKCQPEEDSFEDTDDENWIASRDEFDPMFMRLVKYSGPVVETLQDALYARVTRSQLIDLIHAPFFNELVPGLLVVIETNKFQNLPVEPGIGEILTVTPIKVAYEVDGVWISKMLRVKYGKSVYVCPLDYVTNLPWTEEMFQEYVKRESETHSILSKDYCIHKDKRLWLASEHIFTAVEWELIEHEIGVLNDLPQVNDDAQPYKPANKWLKRVPCHFCTHPGPSSSECEGLNVHHFNCCC